MNDYNSNKKTGKALIPRLRFPEFQNSGEWEVKRIGEFLTESKIPSYANDPRKRITVRLNYGGVEKREYRGTEAVDASNYFIRKKGQFIYGKQNFHKGAFGIIPDDLDGFESSQDLPAFDFAKFINPLFFINTLLRNEFYKTFETFTIGTGSKRLHPSELFKIKIPIPSLPEQQKIASCLSSIDEVIAGERQRLELLKAYKKGLLQNLFPREGETVPKLRFPEFKDSGEWEVTALSELGYLINGLTYSPEDVREKGLLVLRSSNIQDGLIDLKDCVYVRENIKGVNLIKPRDILVCVRNGSKDLIGKNAMIPEGIPLATHGAFMTIFRANNPEFVFQLFQTDYYDKQVRADLGATINSINGKNFIKYKFPVPENPKEQQKIADCLSSLDDVIQAQQQKIELLEQHKKGLLQGLFPNLKQLDKERCNYDI